MEVYEAPGISQIKNEHIERCYTRYAHYFRAFGFRMFVEAKKFSWLMYW